MTKTSRFLRRYTDLLSLFRWADSGALRLSNPNYWEDKNDLATIKKYQKLKKVKVRCLCFSGGPQKRHHWAAYENHKYAVCLTFNKSQITKLAQQQGFLLKPMKYLTYNDIPKSVLNLEDFPFLKRDSYSDESEFRMLKSSDKDEDSFFAVGLNALHSIHTSPLLSKDDHLRMIETIKGNEKLKAMKITRSPILQSDNWNARIENYSVNLPNA